MSYRSRLERAFGRSDKTGPPGNEGLDGEIQDAPIEQPAFDDSPALRDEGATEGPGGLSDIAERLRLLEQQGAEYHRRAAHREEVIDRLHLENQKLRDEVRGSVFDPITADLMRLYDSLRRDAERLAEAGADPGAAKLVNSYAADVELILDRCGLEPFTASPGDTFKLGEHSVTDTIETGEEDRENTIAAVTAIGFRARDTAQVKRPVRAIFYRAAKLSDQSGAD